jgi:hypothetical protein
MTGKANWIVVGLLGSAIGLTAARDARAGGDALKVSGFVDAQYQSAGIDSSFVVQDSALYFSKTMSSGEVMLDLPLSSARNADNPHFSVGLGKAQAYLGYKYESGLSWKIGQFDTPFGFELNDTKDITFSTQGLVYGVIPVVHTGLLVGYSLSDSVGIKLLAANHHDLGTMAGLTPDWGGQLTANVGSIRSSAGLLVTDKNSGEEFLIDLLLGTTLGDLALDGWVDIKKVNNKAGTTTLGTGYFLQAIYGLSDKLSAGVRGELTKNIGVNDTVTQLTVGPQYALTKELKFRADYSIKGAQVLAGGTTATSHSANIGAVYSF